MGHFSVSKRDWKNSVRLLYHPTVPAAVIAWWNKVWSLRVAFICLFWLMGTVFSSSQSLPFPHSQAIQDLDHSPVSRLRMKGHKYKAHENLSPKRTKVGDWGLQAELRSRVSA